jgi:hypothetical protein
MEGFKIPFLGIGLKKALEENQKAHNKLTEKIIALSERENDPSLSPEELKKIRKEKDKKIRQRKLVEQEHTEILKRRGIM